jgi:LacI family transcriptional regulator
MNLKDLSALLKLSPTTVSRALNGYPEVSEATRMRVQAAAQLHNYRPNAQAKRLATGRSMAIGHVIPITTQHEIVNPVFADFIAGAGEVYSAHGYDMILSIVPDNHEERAYREVHAKGNVDGIIVHGPRHSDPRIALLTELDLPFVVHGRSSGVKQGYNWVDVNNARSFERATGLLMDLGHERIALINGLETMDFAARRRAGFENAHVARNLAINPQYMTQGEMTEGQGAKYARLMLGLTQPPTAFVTSSLLSAMGVRRAVEEAGLKIGRDISIVTHDDELGYLRNGEAEPVFTATRSSVREGGRKAAAMLLAQIDARHAGQPLDQHQTILMEASLVLGRSTGPAPHSIGADRTLPPLEGAPRVAHITRSVARD